MRKPQYRKLCGLVAVVTMCCCLLLLIRVDAIREPATGMDFPLHRHRHNREQLHKLGVRTKGPIRVYAVALYGQGTFVLQMARSVGAEKMTSALADALHPRCKASKQCTATDIQAFEELLLKGLPNGAQKKTKLTFETSGGKLSVSVNDRKIGKIKSKGLAQAFASIYTDSKAVCKLQPIVLDGEDDDKPRRSVVFPVTLALAIVAATVVFLTNRRVTKREPRNRNS
jgi:hypothetical protein